MEKIQVSKPYFLKDDIDEIISDIRTIFESGMLMQGQFVERLEKDFAQLIGVKYARAVNSGTAALQTVLNYYNVRDSEVIVPVNTFLASANAVTFEGGKPVFADIDSKTLTVDFEDLKRKTTEKTRGVILVHIAGLISPRTDEIRAWCSERGLFLLEDAAHAHGSMQAGAYAGSLGDAGAFSFLATKVITTGGEGGMVTTNNKELADRVVSLRFHGEDHKRGIQDRVGCSWRMTEIQAIAGITQVRRLNEIVAIRMRVAKQYDDAFSSLVGVKTINLPVGDRHAYYKYPLILPHAQNREVVKDRLEKEFAISSGTCYWPPCHLQPAYKKAFGYHEGMFPVAEDVLNRTIALPMHCHLTDEEIERVIRGVITVCQ